MKKAIEAEEEGKPVRLVHLPPMYNRVSECTRCYSKEVCSLLAISVEEDIPRDPLAGKFKEF